MHDPLYDTPELWEKWMIALAAVIAGLIIACVIFAGSPPVQKQEPAPPAAIPDFRTDIPTGRLVCERRDATGCLEWRIYRESSY